METNNYRANTVKWLPPPDSILEKWLDDCFDLCETLTTLIKSVISITELAIAGNQDLNVIEQLIREFDSILEKCTTIQKTVAPCKHPIFEFKVSQMLKTLKRKLNVLAKLVRNFINEIVDYKSDANLSVTFRLINVYNAILDLDHDVSTTSVIIFCNDCPNMLEPLKKISVTYILQVLAKNRAEEFCHEVIDCLLANYEPHEREEPTVTTTNDLDISENSSIEIYRALTRHLTPPNANSSPTAKIEPSSIESIQTLVNLQNEQALKLLDIVKDISPKLLGPDALTKNNGDMKLRRSAMRKVKDYYQEVSWGALSGILDHVILWWSPEALATHHARGAQHLKNWLRQFVQGSDVPATVRSALQSLCDALGYHATVTVWDELFRLAYTSAFECRSRPSPNEGTDTGQMFVEVFQLLVRLSNECEVGGEWVVGAPLTELPLSEQIVVLHRLDHSVHTARLWAMLEAKIIAHTWELDVFFLLVKGDIVNCIEELSYLKLADHSIAIQSDPVNVQVYVCAKMRTKIVSEVNANVQLLQAAPNQCIDILAKICRVVSLANLHMCFPRSSYWRKSIDVPPASASLYVESYFEKVLLPVLEVIEDHETSNMILRIMCEAWLDYIYLHRIKFSEHGAMQLLTDFAYVTTWVNECPIVSQNVRNHLLKNEVLRRCEGVGRLLLRHPGESIAMHKRLARRTNDSGSPKSPGLERMPAEMYVPNQEQWLELRAPKRYNFCCTE